MFRKTVFVIFLLLSVILTLANCGHHPPVSYTLEPVEYLQPPPSPLQKNVLRTQIQQQQPQRPPTPQPTFMQKIASWFGFGQHTDSDVQSSLQISQYRQAPNKYQHQQQQQTFGGSQTSASIPELHKTTCNPCNKVPWIPMFPNSPTPTQYPIKQKDIVQNNIYREPQGPQNQYFPSFQHQTQINQPSQYQTQQQQVQQGQQQTNPHKTQEHNFHQQYQPPKQYHPQQQYHHYQQHPQFQHQLHQFNQHHKHQPTQLPQTDKYQGITSPEYLLPSQLLPIENEGHRLAPIPIPNLSVTPIPPLHDAKNFLHNPYGININVDNFNSNNNNNKPTNLLEPVPQLTNNVQISKVLPESLPPNIYKELNLSSDTDIEIIKSIPIAQFSTSAQYPINDFYGQNVDSIKHDIQTLNNYIIKPIIVNTDELAFNNYSSSFGMSNVTEATEQYAEKIVITSTTEKVLTEIETINTDSHNYRALNHNHDNVDDTVIVEASILTASQNKDKTNYDNNIINNKERDTPKTLLDSPIHYFRSTTIKPIDSELIITPSPLDFGTWTKTNTSPSPTVPSFKTPSPTSYTYSHGDFKKPKQIQIIIPYTNSKTPTPFKINNNDNINYKQYLENIKFDRNSGWSSQTHDFDIHDQQESKLVTATDTTTRSPTAKYLTKILASNIRELLRKEKYNSTTPSTVFTTTTERFDQTKLQMNIDGWTEQEFAVSDFNAFTNKASTISFLAPSRNFPREYLTTTPITPSYSTVTAPTTPEMPILTDYSTINPEQIKFDSKGINKNNNLNISTKNYNKNPSLKNYDLWKNLGVTISPISKEKVYVVTPQSWSEFKQISSDSIGFKSPRFVIRPSPAERNIFKNVFDIQSTLPYSINNLQTTTTTTNKPLIVPKLFGVMNTFDSYLSPTSEEDEENSKIITIITPSSTSINKKNVIKLDEKPYFQNNNL